MAKETLPFGAGLDRYTGVMAVQPGSMEDLLNTRPLAGKLQARRGMVLRSTLPDRNGSPCTSVRLLQAMQSQQEAIAVGYYGETREVHVFRITGIGTDPDHIDRWFTLEAGAQEPPVFTSAESYGKAFLAHDEPHVGRRAPTVYYDGLKGTLTGLRAAIDEEEPEDLYFRGVERWRDYLVGWGFAGTNDDRPESVRVSLPGRPTEFDREHYFLAGDRGSPVLTCKRAGPHLLVFKPSSTYRIVGTSELNFGIIPSYTLYGTLSARLAITIQNVCFAWSFEGPWATTGGNPEDLESFLDLERPAPEDLPDEGLASQAFAVYIPRDRVVEWHFGARIYCLHLERPGPQWSYRTRSMTASAGALLYSGSGSIIDTSEAIGTPEIVSVERQGDAIVLTWNNLGATGSEVLETWLRANDGQGWYRITAGADVTLLATQTHQVLDTTEDPSTGRNYDIAIRYRLRGRYGTDYQSTDPAQWPAESRSTFTTVKAIAPSIETISWQRASAERELVTIEWQGLSTHRETLTVYRREEGEVSAEVVATDVPIQDGIYRDDTISGETMYAYYYVARLHDQGSEALSNEIEVFTGPPAPVNVTIEPGVIFFSPVWYVRWEAGDDAELGDVLDIDGTEQRSRPNTQRNRFFPIGRTPGRTEPVVRVRHYIESYDTEDLSAWVQAT